MAVQTRYQAVVVSLNGACAPATEELGRVLEYIGYAPHGSRSPATSADAPLTTEFPALAVRVSASLLTHFEGNKRNPLWRNECVNFPDRLLQFTSEIGSTNANLLDREAHSGGSYDTLSFHQIVYLSLVLAGVEPAVVADAIADDKLVDRKVSLNVLWSAEQVRLIFTGNPSPAVGGVVSGSQFIPFLRSVWDEARYRPWKASFLDALTGYRRHRSRDASRAGVYPPDFALAALVTGKANLERNVVSFLRTSGRDTPWTLPPFQPLVKAMNIAAKYIEAQSADMKRNEAKLDAVAAIMDLPGNVFVVLVGFNLVRPPTRAERSARVRADRAIDAHLRLVKQLGVLPGLPTLPPISGAEEGYLRDRIEALSKFVLEAVTLVASLRREGAGATERNTAGLFEWVRIAMDAAKLVGYDDYGVVIPRLEIGFP